MLRLPVLRPAWIAARASTPGRGRGPLTAELRRGGAGRSTGHDANGTPSIANPMDGNALLDRHADLTAPRLEDDRAQCGGSR